MVIKDGVNPFDGDIDEVRVWDVLLMQKSMRRTQLLHLQSEC